MEDRKAWLEELGDDFSRALVEEDYQKCNAIIDQLAEQGFFEEGLTLCRAMCRARMVSRSETV